MGLLEARLQRLTPEQRKVLVDQRSAQRGAIPRVDRGQVLPLSYAQSRLWLLDQLVPNNTSYNISRVFRLTGPLHVKALEAALNEVVRRHEILRTRFQSVDGHPRQLILPELKIPLSIEIPTDGEMEDFAATVAGLEKEELELPFKLDEGPLLRARLARTGEQEHALLLSMHHIVIDGWSTGILFKELSTLYEAFAQGKSSPLAELDIQCADHAVWQRQEAQVRQLEKHLEYSRKQLQDLATLELPSDRRRPASMTYEGERVLCVLSKELTDGIRALSQREDVTVFMTVLAALQILLYRYTGQDDVAVASAIANRNLAEIEPLIGFFVNTLILRTKLGGNPTFREVLRQVRKVCLEAYDHQDLPFDKLVADLHPERNLSRTPLAQIALIGQNMPAGRGELLPAQQKTFAWNSGVFAGLKMEMWANAGKMRFDQEWNVQERNNQLVASVSYSVELFDKATITRTLNHWEQLLRAMSHDLDQRIGDVPLVVGPERDSLMKLSSSRANVECPWRSLHQGFEAQVRRTPDAVALERDGQSLSYLALNGKSNQLARYLRRLGVGPEVRVGLCMERSLDLIVALIGILKAGGAYVPLDPSYPLDRLKYMAENSQITVVLSDGSLNREVLAECGAKIVDVNQERDTILAAEDEDLDVEVSFDNLAYVIYTSGSTGRPKGVAVTHGNVLRLLRATQHWYGFNASDVWVLFHSYAFDVSVWELWGAVLYGGKLLVISQLQSRTPDELYEMLQEQSVTVLNQTPSAFRQLLAVDERQAAQLQVRLLIFAGEALDPKMLAGWRQRHPETHLINMYGITEITVHGTYMEIGDKEVQSLQSVIGERIPDLQMYVLDERMNLVPLGIPGELYVGGAGLARGYLNRPDLTAERFLPDPFGMSAGGRLYKSGDRVRWNSEGQLEYFGRIDAQVKIRGYRIELNEIETALRENQDIAAAAVIARDDTETKRLVAYVVPNYKRGQDGVNAQWQSEQTSHWQNVFDQTYVNKEQLQEATLNIVGWNSSYTREPLPAEEMRAWVSDTVDRIRLLRPKKILEIGCGTGLLLFRLAGACDGYIGTDFSQEALRFVKQNLHEIEHTHCAVELRHCAAHELTGIENDEIDTVVLNSVVQYFPSAEYLIDVLKKSVAALRGQGAIFIGDVRSLPLLGVFHASVALANAASDWTVDELRRHVERLVNQEAELLFDPFLFADLIEKIPQIKGLAIWPKSGNYTNELTQFRYDVVLTVGTAPVDENRVWQEWSPLWTASRVKQYLKQEKPVSWGLLCVPNSRTERAARMFNLLKESQSEETVELFCQRLDATEWQGISPEEWYDLSEDLAYSVESSWARGGGEGRYDLLFTRDARTGSEAWAPVKFPAVVADDKTPRSNQPLRRKWNEHCLPELRERLKQQLPAYMLPAAYVTLDSLPLTTNGKLDRDALPAPDTDRPNLIEEYVAPISRVQQLLAKIWGSVLNLEKVGIHDNFFELGGDSIHAIQAISRANEAGLGLNVGQLFRHQTVAGLAKNADLETHAILTADSGVSLVTESPIADGAHGKEVRSSHLLLQSELDKIRQIPANADLEDVMPLAPSTEHMFLEYFARPELGTPIVQLLAPVRLRESDLQMLELSWQCLVDRHPILRTSFVWEQFEQPLQFVHKRSEFSLGYNDLRGLSPAQQERAIADYLREDRTIGFDPAVPNPVRLSAMQLADESFQILLSANYATMDGWSMSVLQSELGQCLASLRSGKAIELTKPVPYAEFITWVKRQDLGRAREFLVQQIPTTCATTPLIKQAPQFFSANGSSSYRMSIAALESCNESEPIARQYGFLSKDAFASLEQAARQQHLTMSTIANGAWAAVLSRITGQESVLFGIASTGRPPELPGIEQMVGRALNPLPLRADFTDGRMPLVDWLKELQIRQVDLRQYDYVGLRRLQEWAGVAPGSFLLESCLFYQNLESLELKRKTATARKPDALVWMAHYVRDTHPIRVDLFPCEDTILVMLTYRREFFDSATVGSLLELYIRTLEKTVALPGRSVSDLIPAMASASAFVGTN